MPEVNLDQLRELAGHLRNAVRELREIGQTPKESFLGDFDRYLVSIGRYLAAELS